MKHFLVVLLALLLALFPLLPLTGCAVSAETAEDAAQETAGQESAAGTDLEIYCFSAGKADAFLLTTANSAVLIDCGVKGFGQTILDELAARGITSLDYLIVTHFDQDHVGGAAKVLNNITVDNVLQSNCPKDSTEYEKYVKALATASLDAVTVQETLTFTLDGVTYVVDPPHSASYNEDASNNSSLIVSVYNGQNALLFAGDAQTERLEEFLESNPGTYDLLKVPHHGREEPLMTQLLAAVQPSYAVITSSEDKLEDDATVAALEAAGTEVYLTRIAPVIIRSDGTNLTVTYAQ